MNFVDSLKKWFFNNSSSAATTTSKVPLVDNTGNPIGCDTLAHLAQVQDLASVLGVWNFQLVGVNNDLNTLFPTKMSVYYTVNTDNPQNCPNVSNLYNNVIFIFRQGNKQRFFQILVSINIQRLWIRFNSSETASTWGSWKEFSVN